MVNSLIVSAKESLCGKHITLLEFQTINAYVPFCAIDPKLFMFGALCH